MYLVRSLRTFIGTNAERVAAGLGAFLAGDEFIETDTSNKYLHDGMAWRLEPAGSPGGSGGAVQFNDGGAFGGFGVWNDSTNTLTLTKSTSAAAEYFLVLDQDGSGGAHINMIAGSASGKIGMRPTYLDISTSSSVVIAGSTVSIAGATNVSFDPGGYESIVFQGSGSDPAAIFNNPNWPDYHFQVKTENNDYMVYVDSSLDAFQIGTDTAGTIAQFTHTGTVFNNLEADCDFRIAGNGVTNGVFYDGGINTLGINTGSPNSAYKLHVVSTGANTLFERTSTGGAGINVFYNPDSTDGNAAVVSFATDTTGSGATAQKAGVQLWGITNTHNDSTYATEFQIRTRVAGAIGSRFSVTGNVNIDGTTTALVLSRLTTTQQNALTGVNGMIIYNTSTNKFRGYAGGAWVDLH